MADPSIRLSGSATNGLMTSSLTLSPGGTPASGELILIIMGGNESPPFSTPSCAGFSVIASRTDADWNPLYILGKIAGGSEGSSYSVSWSGGARDGGQAGVILVFQNANSSLPTNVATTHDTSASTTLSIPALTTTKNGSFDLVAVTLDGNVGGSGNYSSWGSSLAELFDIADAGSGNYPNLGIAGVTRASAGSQASTTVTSGASDKNVAIRIEVEPAAGGGVTGTIAATLQKATGALSGTETQTGTIASTLQKATAALTGVMQPSGAIAATLAKATAALAGTQSQTGTIAGTLQPATASLAGTQTQTGTVSATLTKATAALAGVMEPSGAIAASLQPATAALAGSQSAPGTETGTIAATLQAATAALAGAQTITGTAAPSLQPATASLVGTEQYIATVAATLQAATAALSGTQSQSGTIAATLTIATVALVGTQTISGSIAATLQAATAALTEVAAAAILFTVYGMSDSTLTVYGGNSTLTVRGSSADTLTVRGEGGTA